MVFSDNIPNKIITSDTSIPDSPSLTIKNPLAKDIFLNGIEMIPNYLFSDKGQLVIKASRRIVFDTRKINNPFTDYSLYNLPAVDEAIMRHQAITFFAWNDTDTKQIAINLKTSISEVKENLAKTNIPISRDAKNRGTATQGTITSPDAGSGIVATIYKSTKINFT